MINIVPAICLLIALVCATQLRTPSDVLRTLILAASRDEQFVRVDRMLDAYARRCWMLTVIALAAIATAFTVISLHY